MVPGQSLLRSELRRQGKVGGAASHDPDNLFLPGVGRGQGELNSAPGYAQSVQGPQSHRVTPRPRLDSVRHKSATVSKVKPDWDRDSGILAILQPPALTPPNHVV